MRDQNARPLTTQTESSTGILLMIGFSGNPRVIVNAVSNSKYVTDITTLRSGTQFELKLELSQRATTRLLRDIVDDLLEFDVQIQGTQTVPVPTLVFSITPAKQARNSFLRRRIGRNRPAQSKPAPLPKSDISANVVVQPAQSFVPPPAAPKAPPTAVTSRAAEHPPGPLLQAAKTTGSAALRIISAEISQAFSILWHVVTGITNFVSKWLTRGAMKAARPFAGWLPKIPGAITKTSLLMTMSVNSLFGAGEGDDDDKKTDAPKINGEQGENDEKPENSDS